MRIATFNIESLDLPVEPRLALLHPALERLEADIVCLQEVNGQKLPGQRDRALTALDRLLEGTRYAGYHRSVTQASGRSGPLDVHNLVTLSRFPVRSQRQLRHDLLPAPHLRLVTAEPAQPEPTPVTFDRPALLTVVEEVRGPLFVVNVHLRAPIASAVPGQKLSPTAWRTSAGWAEGYYLSGLKRIGQALELRLLVEEIFAATPAAQILVAGDFNSEANETPMRLLAAEPEDTGNSEHAGRSLVDLDRSIEASRRFSVVHYGRPQMLDHMLTSHALYGRFRSIEVHNEALGDEAIAYAKRIGTAGSYHAAVVAEFAP